jgi:hypothetical protein
LRKAVSLLNKIEAKTGSATITGPVKVTNEVEIKNDANNPLPVSDNNGSLTVDGTVELGATSLAALENISVTFPSSQNVSVQNASIPVTDNNGSLTVDGSVSVSNFPATQPVTGPLTNTELRATEVLVKTGNTIGGFPMVSIGSDFPGGALRTGTTNPLPVSLQYTAANSTALKVDGSAVTQPVSGTFFQATQPVSLATAPTTPVTGPLTNTELRATAVPISGTVTANTGLTQPLTDTQLRAASVPISQGTAANLNATVVQGTATNLRTAAEVYTNGFPISSTNALTIKTTNALGSNSPVVQLGYSISGVGIVTPSDVSGFPIRPSSSATFPVTGTFWQATQPVSGTVTAAQATAANLNATVVGSGSFTAAQATASNLKAQAQLLNSAGTVVEYATTGSAGTPATDVVTVQGISGGTSIPISGTVNTYPQQGTTVTNSNFTSTTSATLVSAVADREVLTIYNEGAGTLFINVGGSCSTTSYQVRLFSGEYWEAPAGQQSLQHSGIYSTAGTARVTQIS